MRLRGRRRDSATGTSVAGAKPPIPPVELRRLVGPTDAAAFDNPSGALVFEDVDPASYEAVFDFGCGCGRVARKLIQQDPSPVRYLGIDIHRGMVDWCRHNLAPCAPQFEFRHHDVFNLWLNPGPRKPRTLAFPTPGDSFTLVVAHSVFTHLNERQAEHYLREVARVLGPSGLLRSTWFLFDKALFPMMQPFQNALFVNDEDTSNAVIFDRAWLTRAARAAGLTICAATPPAVRGFQWVVSMTADPDAQEVALPPDDAPIGGYTPPPMPRGVPQVDL